MCQPQLTRLLLFLFLFPSTQKTAAEPHAIDPAVIREGIGSGSCPAASTLDSAKASTRAAISSILDDIPCVVLLNLSDPNQGCPSPWQVLMQNNR